MRLKRTLSIVLLATLISGLMPAMTVYADWRDTPNGGQYEEDWNELLNSDNIIGYYENLQNWEPVDNVLTSVENHINNYSTRFKGLVSLCLSDEDVTTSENDYGVAIDISITDSEVNMSRPRVSIGDNTIVNRIPLSKFFEHNGFAQDDENTLLKYKAMVCTAYEYAYYADVLRIQMNTYVQQHDGKLSSTYKSYLNQLHEIFLFSANGTYDDNGATGEDGEVLFQTILDLWLAEGPEGDLGLVQLWELCNDDMNIIVDNFGNVSQSEPIEGQPLKDFYEVYNVGGLTSIDMNAMAHGNHVSVSVDTNTETEREIPATATAIVQDTGNSYVSYVTLGENVVQGIAYSAGYIPMQTNLYSTATINGYDTQWLTDWHYKYGFMRKALLYDTSATAAMDYYNTLGTTKGNVKVCTLRQFIELGEKDLVLYVDESFYNAEECEDLWLSSIDTESINLGEFIDDLNTYLVESYGKDETQSDFVTVDANFINDTYDVDLSTYTENELKELLAQLKRQQRATDKSQDFMSILKTGKYKKYSDRTRSALAKANGNFIENAVDGLLDMNNQDLLVMDSATITDTLDAITNRVERGATNSTIDYEYTTYDEYTPMFSFAYVSSIYRSPEAYKVSNINEINTPVFIASDDVAQLEDAPLYDKGSLLNYALVRNLPSMVQIDYTYSMDMDSPVYIDIYGNIMTESGLVIIPAACNATLFPDDYSSNIYSLGMYACYGRDYYIPTSLNNVEPLLGTFFVEDEENGGVWKLNGASITTGGSTVGLTDLDTYTQKTAKTIASAFMAYVYKLSPSDHDVTNVLWPKYVNLINETMRGAPLEHIDKEAENLRTNGNINKTSILAAAKLESLIKSLRGSMSNTFLSVPDFTTMDKSEYVIAFLFKMLLVATVIVVIIQVYQDAVASRLGIRTFMTCAWAVFLTFSCLMFIPLVFELTYYTANKLLLQNETTKICMYNLEKSQSGVEVGVTETSVPDTHNKIMVQLDWVSVPWYMEVEELLFGESLKSVSIARDYAVRNSLVALQEDVQFYNDGIYMDVEDIFNSVSMDYTFNVGEAEKTPYSYTLNNGLYLYSNGSPQSLSFYSPYYVFLEALTANVNSYNYLHNSYMYTTKLQSGNRLKTVGLCSNYFQSETFMETDNDILHLYEVYGVDKPVWIDGGKVFTEDQLESMRASTWYHVIDLENVEKRISIVNEYCRDFVAENRELLDKVTDETFIKVMALSMAMKYNQVFGTTEANCYEIYNLNSDDLMRLSISKTDDAMLTSPLSYSRFVLDVGGESAVYAASVLEMVMYIGSFIKPLCIIISFISVFMSIFVFRVLLRKKNNSLLGYVATVLLIGATNFLHAVILKLSTYLPEIGLSMLGCIIVIIIFQIMYLLALGYVTGNALRYWQDLGAAKYEQKMEIIRDRIRGTKNTNYLSSNVKHYDNNWDYYNELVEQHRERNTTI